MKAAVFVEGHTEVVFVKELILQLANKGEVSITEEQFHGGAFFVTVSTVAQIAKSEILIANCCNDGKVATAIRDRYNDLEKLGYSSIIGLRDLYPYSLQDLQIIKAAIATIMPRGSVPANVIVAVAEVEAWFIEEETHFSRIDANLTSQAISAATQYDISSGCAETIYHPAQLLHEIYQVAQKAYRKRASQIARTVAALDYGNLYVASRARSNSLDEFIRALEGVLA